MKNGFYALKSVLIVCFFVLLISLGIRSLILKDSRFGWGMFMEQVNYNTTFNWIYPDGSMKEYIPSNELNGLPKKKIGSGNTRYGRGAVHNWTKAYINELPRINRDSNAIGLQAIIHMKINRKSLLKPDTITNYFDE